MPLGSFRASIEDWFKEPGAYVLVDGQFGSTGKGLFAAYIAEKAAPPAWVTTNAGPNSGHTAYFGDDKIVTQQIPVSSVIYQRLGHKVDTLINAGAIIDPKRLSFEITEYLGTRIPFIHPCAALIEERHRELDQQTLHEIASTGKGTGPALMAKISRTKPLNVAKGLYMPMLPSGHVKFRTWDNFWDWDIDTVFVETAQGFSLGLNSVTYPYVTSRECTVMQAIADARIPAQMVKQVVMCVRTFPIRVGDTDNTSGPGYADQRELTWDELGVEPETTTVTGRIRRVFTWSREQFRAAVAANRPDIIFLNFLEYLPFEERGPFIQQLEQDYGRVMGHGPKLYYGFGPKAIDIHEVWWKGPR